MKIFTLVLFFIVTTPVSFSQPFITSFSPASAPVGTIVTISGNNFSNTVSNNIVYFGGVMASVSSASAISVTVIVPKGAASDLITLITLDNNLMCYSSRPFMVKFAGGDDSFNSNSFGNSIFFPCGDGPNSVAAGDLDGDGKPDIVSVNYTGGNGSGMSLLRNTSTYSNISFAPAIDWTFVLSSSGNGAKLADIDGDGQLDIVVAAYAELSVFKNISTPGNINFSPAAKFTKGLGSLSGIQINDLDKDGKPDIALINNGLVSVFRNTSILNNILLDSPLNINAGILPDTKHIRIADIDGDGKWDICATNFTSNTFSVLRNKSITGIIAFAAPSSFSTGANSNPSGLSISDIDGDEIPDISIANYGIDELRFFKNKSKPGIISFEILQFYVNQYQTSMVGSNDLNGDGKPEILDNTPNYNGISIIKNKSTPCHSKLGPAVSLNGNYNGDICVYDLNGDGKPEILLPSYTSNGISVYKNNINQTVTGCVAGTTIIPSYLSGASYQWQQNGGGGFSNINNSSNFSGTNAAVLQIINPPLSWNGYQYRCLAGADTSNVFLDSVNTNFVPGIAISNCPVDFCAGDTTLFTASLVNAGAVPLLQWQDSTNATGWSNINGATSTTLKYATNFNGTKVRSIMTSSYSCAIPSILTSNIQKINFVCPVITRLCPNGNTQFTSNIISSFYQWQLDTGSGYTVIADNSTYTGSHNITLQINNIPSSAYGYKYRCVVDAMSSNIFTLNFSNIWTGSVNNQWESPGNWSCGSLPDSNSDVYINSGTLVLNSNATIRSLSLNPGVNFIVNSNIVLTILH